MYGYDNIYRSMEGRRCRVCGQSVFIHDLHNGVCSRCYWSARSSDSMSTMIIDEDGRRF